MYEKFAICCIYDKISAGFYRVQILRKAYENVSFFSVGAVLASLWIHFYSHESSMEFPWICAFELFVLKRIFSYNKMAMP